MSMRVLVTGGAGFIGANLCRELTSRPEIGQVLVVDDLSTGTRENLRGVDVDFVEGSILDAALLERLLRDIDSVVHLAARSSVPRSVEDPLHSHEVNATGTLRVLEACRRNGIHVIVASSSSVYGSVAGLPKHEDLATRPISPYGASKLCAESYALAYCATFGVPTLPVRFFNVFGPFQPASHAYAAVIPAFIDAALAGEPLTVHGDGGQTRDFTFVGTVVQVLAEAVVRQVTSEVPLNVAFGNRVSLTEVIDILGGLVGRRLDVRHEQPRLGDVRDSQAASGRLKALFPGVTPVPLEAGLAHTVRWFAESRVDALVGGGQ